MQRYRIICATAIIVFAATTQAHVRVQPAESGVGLRESYTVRVPTEGNVATSFVELEVPGAVSVVSATNAEMKKTNGRISSILWRVEIPPGQTREFIFEAINPRTAQDILWKAHQHFADGSVSDWTDGPRSPRPASVTKLRTP